MSGTFQRIEKKYQLTKEQYDMILSEIQKHMNQDKFFHSVVSSIYYDNDNYELIRRSIEKPFYKEKLRIRCYDEPKPDDLIFVEVKKKLDGIVYKRRTKGKYIDVLKDIYTCSFEDKQIGDEIKYMLSLYGELKPKIFISCVRESYKGENGLRVTFDSDLVYRENRLNLSRNSEIDKPITDKIIMELKVECALPLWLSNILDKTNAHSQGFSKVGTAYKKERNLLA